MLDDKGPEIRTGYLVDGKAVDIVKDSIVNITTDYSVCLISSSSIPLDQGRCHPPLLHLQGSSYQR